MWQLAASGQSMVTSSAPAVSVTGTEAVCQVSQLPVAGRESVRVVPPAVTVAVRVWFRPSPPRELAYRTCSAYVPSAGTPTRWADTLDPWLSSATNPLPEYAP